MNTNFYYKLYYKQKRQIKLAALKIKIKSLSEEARIIRKDENKSKKLKRPWVIDSLHEHRIHVVRPEVRAANIAYGLLRGKTLEQIEPNRKNIPHGLLDRVNKILDKYKFVPSSEAIQLDKEWNVISGKEKLNRVG